MAEHSIAQSQSSMKTNWIPSLLVIGALFLFLPHASSAASASSDPVAPVAARTASKDSLKAEVAGMEDGFCAMAKEKGLRAAFEYFAAPNVAFVDTDPRKFRGLAAVRERIGPDQPGVSLTWSAIFTDVSDDGTLGYNWGRYEWRGAGTDGQPVIRGGFFLTIWKRQPDGTWRYVMDNGAPDRPAPSKE